MQVTRTALDGVLRIGFPTHRDERGAFRRSWCADSFAQAGIIFHPLQGSLSINPARHTLRGMHWQADPHGEQKLVRCVAGSIWDVALDLRAGSATHGRWHAEELSAENGLALFLPQGIAHGFLTLTEGAVVEYMIDAAHHAPSARGVRWDDPAFGIAWPAAPAVIGARDRDWPLHG